MKKLIWTFLLLPTLLLSQKTYNPTYFNAFPKYEEVLKQYLSVNEVNNNIQFAKKYEGWYVQTLDKRNISIVTEEQLIWNATNQKYTFETPNEIPQATNQVQYFLNQFSAKFYDIAPVFGYNDAHQDNIELLGKQSNLSADLLNVLARAYGTHCNKMMGRLPTSKQPFGNYFKTFNTDDISKEALADYIKYANLSIEQFQLLAYKYPEFQTIVGNIKLKYWNEYISHYLNLMLLNQPEAARKFLKDDLYDEYFINYAKNMLTTCAENAILFTYGDTDTYSLLYTQEKLGFRKDITIINVSLCATVDYINYLTKLLPADKQLKLTSSINKFIDKNEYLLVGKADNPVNANMFLQQFERGELEASTVDPNVLVFPNQEIEINNLNLQNITAQFGEGYSFEKTMKWTFSTNYILRSYLIILDAITTNQWKRPIYFTAGTTPISRLYLEEYIELEGLAYRLTPHKEGKRRINKTIILDHIQKDYVWTVPPQEYREKGQMMASLGQYLNLYIQLLTQTTDKKIKEQVLLKMQQDLPIGVLNYETFSYPIADAYYEIGEMEVGDEILIKGGQTLVDLIKKQPNNQYYKRLAKAFIGLASIKNRTVLQENLERILKDYLPK